MITQKNTFNKFKFGSKKNKQNQLKKPDKLTKIHKL